LTIPAVGKTLTFKKPTLLQDEKKNGKGNNKINESRSEFHHKSYNIFSFSISSQLDLFSSSQPSKRRRSRAGQRYTVMVIQ